MPASPGPIGVVAQHRASARRRVYPRIWVGLTEPPLWWTMRIGERMNHFTPFSALIGGLFIGLASSILLLFNGRLAGVSGILGGVVVPRPGGVAWRLCFLGGLVAGGLALRLLAPQTFPAGPAVGIGPIAAAGLLVGFGTRLGGGCTSGHGVSGLSLLSGRSLAATLTFMAAGALTVLVVRHLAGGP